MSLSRKCAPGSLRGSRWALGCQGRFCPWRAILGAPVVALPHGLWRRELGRRTMLEGCFVQVVVL